MSDVRPPVDPLSDVSWARLERGLWARMDRGEQVAAPAPEPARRRWVVPVLAAAMMAATITVVVIATGGASEDGPLSHAIAHAPAPAPAPAPPAPAPIAAGSDTERTRVVTESAPTSATFGDVGVALAAQTAIEYAHDPANVHLERGDVWFTVAPRGTRPAFAVFAADAKIEVIGTRFHVARDLEHVVVEVDHGAVRVEFRGTTHLLHDGERWDSAPPHATTTPATKTTPAPTVDDRTRFEQLTALESRDPDAAITGYLALAKQRGSAWAELAAFAAARLAVDGHDARAKLLLDAYLTRYPGGANAADARQLLTRLKGP